MLEVACPEPPTIDEPDRSEELDDVELLDELGEPDRGEYAQHMVETSLRFPGGKLRSST